MIKAIFDTAKNEMPASDSTKGLALKQLIAAGEALMNNYQSASDEAKEFGHMVAFLKSKGGGAREMVASFLVRFLFTKKCGIYYEKLSIVQ